MRSARTPNADVWAARQRFSIAGTCAPGSRHTQCRRVCVSVLSLRCPHSAALRSAFRRILLCVYAAPGHRIGRPAALPPTLKHLELSSNLLGAVGMAALAGHDGRTAATSPHLTNLQTLNLGTNGWDPSLDESRIFRSQGCLALVPALSRLPALTELLLENNFVETEGVEAVRRALEGRSVQLRS